MSKEQPQPEVMVELIKVAKEYPPDVEALSGVSLSVHKGEMVFLTGRSGAGKTTLLKLLCRIETPTKGLVEVAGMDIGKLRLKKVHLLRRKIGMAYQDFKLLPDRTVAENIAITMEVVYHTRSTIQSRTRKLLEQLGLKDKYSTIAAELSRGEQQRVTIARAVANQPDLILADEPTGNLDGETTELVMNLLRGLNRKGATLIIATHDQTVYRPESDRVVELRYGRIVDEPIFSEAGNKDPADSFLAPDTTLPPSPEPKEEKIGFLPWG